MPILILAGAAIAASLLAALGLLLILRRRWSPTKLRETNDVTISCITAAGTIYAVILTFMLSSVWEDFKEAKLNAEREADALIGVFQLAGGLTDPRQTEIRDLTRAYAQVIVGEEWGALAREQMSPRAEEYLERMWQAVTRTEANATSEQVIVNHLLAGLTRVSEHRRIRQVQSRTALPSILWVVLVFGGAITVGNSCLLGVENAWLHLLYIISLTCFITLMLVAVADIDQPFRGNMHVGANSFEAALAAFNRP